MPLFVCHCLHYKTMHRPDTDPSQWTADLAALKTTWEKEYLSTAPVLIVAFKKTSVLDTSTAPPPPTITKQPNKLHLNELHFLRGTEFRLHVGSKRMQHEA